MQGRRRVFKSGPAEEIIKCRWYERGEHERGTLPLVIWGVRVTPEKILNFYRFYVRFLWGFMRLGPDFSHDFWLEKIFLGA